MLTTSELQLLAFLTKNRISGRGKIIDLGCARGGSTFALAVGLDRNPLKVREQVTGFDVFPELAKDFSGRAYSFEITKGLLQEWGDRIEFIQGDITQFHWTADPIELLYVDVMKSVAIAEHVIKEFFPYVVQGGWVVHQDFKDPTAFWIIPTMYRLRTHFQMSLSIHDGQTVLFCCTSVLSPEEAAVCANLSTLHRDEIDAAFEWALGMLAQSAPWALTAIESAYQRAVAWLQR